MLNWWEKTVEYYFVRKFIDEKMLIAPLDGNEEKAGDAILGSGYKWILIEFKKNVESIKTEYKKFDDYLSAKNEMYSLDGHHFLVYGLLNEEQKAFAINAITYFSNKTPKDINNLLSAGIDLKSFQSYLNKFVSFKRSANDGGGGGGGGALNNSMVAGVIETGGESKIVKCMSLMEYILTMQKSLVHSQSLVKKRDIEPDRGPSLGM